MVNHRHRDRHMENNQQGQELQETMLEYDNKIKEIQDKVEEYEFNCICGYSAPTEEEGTHIDEERGGWKACNNCGMI